LEQTKAGLRFKAPKTKGGRRTIALSASVAEEHTARRGQQSASRLAWDEIRVPWCSPGSTVIPSSRTR
jgi:hypothetical protein